MPTAADVEPLVPTAVEVDPETPMPVIPSRLPALLLESR